MLAAHNAYAPSYAGGDKQQKLKTKDMAIKLTKQEQPSRKVEIKQGCAYLDKDGDLVIIIDTPKVDGGYYTACIISSNGSVYNEAEEWTETNLTEVDIEIIVKPKP